MKYYIWRIQPYRLNVEYAAERDQKIFIAFFKNTMCLFVSSRAIEGVGG